MLNLQSRQVRRKIGARCTEADSNRRLLPSWIIEVVPLISQLLAKTEWTVKADGWTQRLEQLLTVVSAVQRSVLDDNLDISDSLEIKEIRSAWHPELPGSFGPKSLE